MEIDHQYDNIIYNINNIHDDWRYRPTMKWDRYDNIYSWKDGEKNISHA
jgi:hypothetical protein